MSQTTKKWREIELNHAARKRKKDYKKGTPIENAQRWMGKNTFQILLLNDRRTHGNKNEMPNMCPFERKK